MDKASEVHFKLEKEVETVAVDQVVIADRLEAVRV